MRRKKSRHEDCWLQSKQLHCDAKRNQCSGVCDSDDQCGRHYYCDRDVTHTCYRAAPVLVSHSLAKLYDEQIALPRKWPKLNDCLQSRILGSVFTAQVGASPIGEKGASFRSMKVQLVGCSHKAIDVGITVPLGYMRQWNRARAPRDPTTKKIQSAHLYTFQSCDSVLVKLRSAADTSVVTAYAKTLGLAAKTPGWLAKTSKALIDPRNEFWLHGLKIR